MGSTLLLIVTNIFGGIKIIVAYSAYINIHTNIYMCVYTYIYMCVCVCVGIHTHIYITLYTHNTHMGFPHSSVCKESAYNAGDLGSIPGL